MNTDKQRREFEVVLVLAMAPFIIGMTAAWLWLVSTTLPLGSPVPWGNFGICILINLVLGAVGYLVGMSVVEHFCRKKKRRGSGLAKREYGG